MVVDLGPFEEFLPLDQAQKFRLADEAVAPAVDFARSRRAGGVGDRVLQFGVQLKQAPEHRVLPYSARSGDHDQKPRPGLGHLITAL